MMWVVLSLVNPTTGMVYGADGVAPDYYSFGEATTQSPTALRSLFDFSIPEEAEYISPLWDSSGT
jgi:hypothetical protein